MEHYIKILNEHGITHVDMWLVPSDVSNDSKMHANNEDASQSPQSLNIKLEDKNTNFEDKERGK